MKLKPLGRTGLKVSEVCLGTMTFGNQADETTSFAIMSAADHAGINFIDTADVYPLGGGLELVGTTEEIVGDWIQEHRARSRTILATKCRGKMGPWANDEGLSRRHIIAACEASLKRLKTDYIDLYQAHSPDPGAPIEETLAAMDDLVRSGKVRYAGCSNYPAWQITEALWASDKRNWCRFESVQPRYNLIFRMIEDEILPLCRAQNLAVISYNPLAGGMLTGRYRKADVPEEQTRFSLPHAGELYRKRYWNEEVFDVVGKLDSFLSDRGKSLTHVALAWVLDQPEITSAIIGASRTAQLDDSLRGVGLQLDEEELKACDEAWFALPRERDPHIARR